MREQGPTNKKKTIVLGLFVVAAAVGAGAYFLDRMDLRNLGGGRLTYDAAAERLATQVGKIDWREDLVDRVAQMPLETRELEQTLPAINTFPLVVEPPASSASAEIFVSTEKSGSGSDGWMVEVANAFNATDKQVKSGRRARVRIRKIASGTGFQFIASGKYRPDAFSPSNHLWVRMAEARGVKMTPIREKTVGNIAGLVMKEEVAERLAGGAGLPAVADIVNAVVQGDVVAGYTNPYASSTGLNFLVTVLATFSDGEEARMLAAEVASAFVEFQRNVPFVALTTLQMRESVRRDGSLDAFVMEYQTFAKTAELASGYRFVPFGVRHDNPLYAVGSADAETREVLELFARFMEQSKYRNLARKYGFDPDLAHDAPFAMPAGETLLAAQQLWKEKKDAGRRIAAVFVSDVSGSMRGTRLNELKRALTEGASFIAPQNSIGLVQFNQQVTWCCRSSRSACYTAPPSTPPCRRWTRTARPPCMTASLSPSRCCWRRSSATRKCGRCCSC